MMKPSFLAAMSTTAVALCIAALATGCSNGRSGTAQTSPSPTLTLSVPTTQDAQTVASTATDTSATASPSASASGTCALVASDEVEQAMHLTVQTVEVTDNGCTFHFRGGDHGDIVVTYKGQGGHDELDSERKAGEGAKMILGGIAAAASAPPAAMGMMSATPPPDVAKVGDDQYFVTEGPVTQFFAIKGDAYVEVEGGFLPEGVSRWVIFPEIARRVLATR